MRTICIFLTVFLTACSQQGMYEAMQQNQCLEQTGKIYCDEVATEPYDEYKRNREELLETESSQ